MDGFPAQDQYFQTRLLSRQRVPSLLAGITFALSLCMSSGCATMQGAKGDLHLATCSEADALCGCSCGECTAKTYADNETIVHSEYVSSTHAAGQQNMAIPPQRQNPLGTAAVQPKMMSIEGMSGVWTPEPSVTANSGFRDPPATVFNNGAHAARNFAQGTNEKLFGDQGAQEMSSAPFGQTQYYHGSSCPPDSTRPDSTRTDEDVKEYRIQLQILSQQLSQMKQAQDSIKTSQETLQQSHDREILELKLQQTTADRDRLAREREMDRELQKQRERDLETIDSFSQIIENVSQAAAPQIAAPGVSLRSIPRTSTQSAQEQSKPSELLPTVDANR